MGGFTSNREFRWKLTLAIILIVLATSVYYVHFLIFRDVHHIFLYLIGDIGFVFFEVLLVALVIHGLLHYREQKALQNKLNMLVGAFFSEMGTELLNLLSDFDAESQKVAQYLDLPDDWSEKEFLNLRELAERHDSAIHGTHGDLEALKRFLMKNKKFILDLLQNPTLIENEPFTDLIWAVFYLAEELAHRPDLKKLSDSDHNHLTNDIRRVYHILIVQWMDYINRLKTDYPYLFPLARRKNPIEKKTSFGVK